MAQGARTNLQLTLLLLVLAGCRSRILEPVVPDVGSTVDLAFTPAPDLGFTPVPDLAFTPVSRDLAGSCGGAACAGDEICVYINRGDCSYFACVKPPASCAANISCACLGTSLCPTPMGNGEIFTCMTAPPGVGTIECASNRLCI